MSEASDSAVFFAGSADSGGLSDGMRLDLARFVILTLGARQPLAKLLEALPCGFQFLLRLPIRSTLLCLFFGQGILFNLSIHS